MEVNKGAAKTAIARIQQFQQTYLQPLPPTPTPDELTVLLGAIAPLIAKTSSLP